MFAVKLRSKLRSKQFPIPANIKNTGLPKRTRAYMEGRKNSVI